MSRNENRPCGFWVTFCAESFHNTSGHIGDFKAVQSRNSDLKLSAGNAHVACDSRLFLLDCKLMPLGFEDEQASQRLINTSSAMRTENVTKLDLVVMTQAAIDGARRSHSDPVATSAEIIA